MEMPSGLCHIVNMEKKPKRPRDVSQLAKMMVDIASGESPATVAAETKPNQKHIGGKKGGKARALSLAPEDRIDIARAAAMARWKKG
jgi:hypothetical protein